MYTSEYCEFKILPHLAKLTVKMAAVPSYSFVFARVLYGSEGVFFPMFSKKLRPFHCLHRATMHTFSLVMSSDVYSTSSTDSNLFRLVRPETTTVRKYCTRKVSITRFAATPISRLSSETFPETAHDVILTSREKSEAVRSSPVPRPSSSVSCGVVVPDGLLLLQRGLSTSAADDGSLRRAKGGRYTPPSLLHHAAAACVVVGKDREGIMDAPQPRAGMCRNSQRW